jgi:Polysaccharide pyruvyl transferase
MNHAQRATVLKRDYTPGQILSLLEHFEFCVGMRLHFLIFSALAGVPFVALPYAAKVKGFVDEMQLPSTPALDHIQRGRTHCPCRSGVGPERRAAVAYPSRPRRASDAGPRKRRSRLEPDVANQRHATRIVGATVKRVPDGHLDCQRWPRRCRWRFGCAPRRQEDRHDRKNLSDWGS